MQIFEQTDAMLALWDFLSPLQSTISMYKQTVDEAEENIPESYLVIRVITDGGAGYGDGRANLKRSTADIHLVLKIYH